MDSERFRALVDAYGADPARWPSAERDAARAFLKEADGADAAHYRAAQSLDRMLAAAPAQRPSAALVARVLESARARSAASFLDRMLVHAGLGARAGFAAACLALVSLGTAAGWASGHGALSDEPTDDVLLMAAYGDVYEDLFVPEGFDGS